jgi:hypothetical protein
MNYATNAHVAELLDLPIEDVEALADELGVPDDAWTAEDIDDAEALLDQEDDGDDDDDDPDEDEEDDEDADDEDADDD